MIFTHDIYYPVVHRSDSQIEALKHRYETFDETSIPTIIKHSGFTAHSWKKPDSWSTSHVIYLVTVKEQSAPIVLRANIGWGEEEYYMQVEKSITDRVAALGVPVNRILFVDVSRKNFPFDYQIQQMLVGRDIENAFAGSLSYYDQLSFDLGRYVASWGVLKFDGFGRFAAHNPARTLLVGTKQSMYAYIIVRLDEDIKFLVDGGLLDSAKANAIRKLFNQYKDPINAGNVSTLIHHDLADHNIMFDSKRSITGIFDWEAAVCGDPVLDLVSAPTWKTHFPREDKMVEGYRSIRDLPEYFKEKMDIYRLRTMLWKMVYAIRAGILNKDRMKKFENALEPFKLS